MSLKINTIQDYKGKVRPKIAGRISKDKMKYQYDNGRVKVWKNEIGDLEYMYDKQEMTGAFFYIDETHKKTLVTPVLCY